MKRIVSNLIFLSIVLFLFFSGSGKTTATIDKQEAQNAFEYLNKVRQNPKEYSEEIGVDLKKVKALHPLIWNDILAKVAEERAIDMAVNNYFSHIDKKGRGINILIHKAGYTLRKEFRKYKRDNFFESIAMGQEDGIEAIKDLIIDEGLNPPRHREHLLGMDKFSAECYDIGIGFARTDIFETPTYICIIIAKHE